MKENWKPNDHSVVAPYLMIKKVSAVIDFLEKLFKAERLRFQYRPDGSLMHGELKIGDSVIMLSEETADFAAFPVWLHIYVPDVDSTYRQALEMGAESLQVPTQHPGEIDKRGGIKDPSGNAWWISTQQQASE